MISEIFSSSKGKTIHRNRTICELHRELFDMVVLCLYEKDPDLLKEIVNLLERCFVDGVKMNRRLVRYKLGSSSKWDKKEYAKSNYTKKEIKKIREERIRLEKILIENEAVIRNSKKGSK